MTVRLGVLGAARITPDAIIRPARSVDGVDVVAVAARDQARAEAFAAEHDIPVVIDSYDKLVDADDIDAVYVPLPISLHEEWVVRAAAAGKHVLVEKAFALDAAQARRMVDAGAAAGVVVAEAYHYAYHPAVQRAVEAVRSGELGEVVEVEAAFEADVLAAVPGAEVYTSAPLGGGALYHLGCYCAHFCRTVLGEEPVEVEASARFGDAGIDLATAAVLRFPGGAVGRVASSVDAVQPRVTAVVRGTQGEFTVDMFVAPHLASGADATTSYDYQLAAFRDSVLEGADMATGGDEPVKSMTVLDMVRRAAESSR